MSRRIRKLVDALRFALWRGRDWVKRLLFGRRHTRATFTRIYEQNLWGAAESVSGTGSTTSATEVVRVELPLLLRRLGVRHLLDAPCGDFAWMREVVGDLDCYTGVDIVPDLIERNRTRYAAEVVRFICADICTDDLPAADLILCRDCFIHLPLALIRAALRNFQRSGARYLLLTNCAGAAPYSDIPVGSFRPIDFRRPPFSFPEPLAVIQEAPEAGRGLCLWDLATLQP